MTSCKFVCLDVLCRFDQFLRENEHTYIHPDKQTYNSSIAFLHHLKTKIPCRFAHACRGNIQPTWKIDVFFFSKTRNSHFHGQGHVFRRKRQKNVKKIVLRCRVWMSGWPLFPTQATEMGPSLHTYMDACRFKDRRFFHVCLLFHGLRRGNGLWGYRKSEKTTLFLPPQLVTLSLIHI